MTNSRAEKVKGEFTIMKSLYILGVPDSVDKIK